MNQSQPTKLLVFAEHDDGQLKLATLAAVACAKKVCADTGGEFEILVVGQNLGGIADSLKCYGAATVLVADDPALKHPLADKYARLIADQVKQRGASMVLAAASTYSKDILPRAAAIVDAGMLGDVTSVVVDGSDFTFDRVMYAGNVIGTVKLAGPIKFFTVRSSAYQAPDKIEQASPVSAISVDAAALPNTMAYIARDEKPSGRPDATEARVVVSGGRAIKNADDFEKLVGGLADKLGAAVGSSRALVDSGITPNTLQIGQTGKIVAPDLYIGLGISGAIQHLAGMKDTKVIVAINQDAEAPIFEIADYGLVADIYQVVPELIAKLEQA